MDLKDLERMKAKLDAAGAAIDKALALPYEEPSDREERTYQVRRAGGHHIKVCAAISAAIKAERE